MKNPLRHLLPLLLGAFVASRPAAAATTPRGLVVTDLTLWNGNRYWRQGSLLVRAQVDNPTAAAETVHILQGSASHREVSADVTVPAGGRVLVELPLPQRSTRAADALVAIDGSGKETHVSNVGRFVSWNRDTHSLYVSRSMSGEALRDQLKEAAKASSFHSLDFEALRSSDVAAPWPVDGRAYSVFSGVFLDVRDIADIPADARTALLDYAAGGGSLFFVGAQAIPPEFTNAPFPDAFAPVWGKPVPGESLSLRAVRPCGLGLLAAVPGEVGAAGAEPVPKELSDAILARIQTTRGIFDNDSAGLVEHPGMTLGRPPVLMFLLLLLAFAILAGPVTLTQLARRNLRIHILWVLPAISAVFSLAIVLSLLLTEGVRPTVDIRAVALLDQRAGRVFARTAVSTYSPLTLNAIDLPSDAIVCPPDAGNGRVRMGRTARYEGFLAPRTPGRFDLLQVHATPLRIDIRQEPGAAPTVVNALGAPIRNLVLRDASGALWRADDVAPGATATLAPFDGPFPVDPPVAIEWLPNGSSHPLSVFSAIGPMYRAEIVAAPFLDDPLPGRKAHRKGKTILLGRF